MKNQQDKNQHYENLIPDGNFEDIEQAIDIKNLPSSLLIAGGQTVQFTNILNQEVCEGVDPWTFDISPYLFLPAGVTVVRWSFEIEVLTGGPDLRNTSISSTGTMSATIPGAEGDQSVSGADEITEDENYRIYIGAELSSAIGSVGQNFQLKVDAAPDWTDNRFVMSTTERRSNNLVGAVYPVVMNDPTSYEIISQPVVVSAQKAAPDTSIPGGFILVDAPEGLAEAPSLVFDINNFGWVMLRTTPSPPANYKYVYTFTVRAKNDCGWDDKDIVLDYQELPAYWDPMQDLSNFSIESTIPPTRMQSGLELQDRFLKNREIAPGAVDFFELVPGGENQRYTIDGTDPVDFAPALSINSRTGVVTMSNQPLVHGDATQTVAARVTGFEIRQVAIVKVFVKAYNTAGATQITPVPQFEIQAVPPEWSATVFSSLIQEYLTGTFTYDRTREITNYQYSHSMSDPITFTLINSPSWAKIDENTGVISYTAPEVTGSNTPGATGYNPSDDYVMTIRARNKAGSEDKTFTLTVENSSGTTTGGGGVITPFKEFDESGYGHVEDYTIQEGEEINFNIRQYLDTEWFRLRQIAMQPWFFFLTEIRAESSSGPPPQMAITTGPDLFESDNAYQRRLDAIPDRLIIHPVTGVMTGTSLENL